MTGIAGTLGDWAGSSHLLAQSMAEALRVSPDSKIESWSDPSASLCRLRNPRFELDRQPLFSADRRTCMVFYGECFGYESHKRELIGQGHAFSADGSDAEYVLRAYEALGEAAFLALSGSFCCAIYDAADHSVRLVSDRLGSRPLFYAATRDGHLAFATRVAPLLAVPGVSRELETTAVLEFCTLQKVLGLKTFHRGVSMLPPASILHFHNGELKLRRYWTPHYEPRSGSLAQYSEELSETIRAAMKEIQRGPGRLGILLSGGLDARMMVAAAEKDATCYCFGDYENFEFQVARMVAEAKGLDVRFLRRDPDHYSNILDPAVELGSGMHPFNHAHALGFVETIAEQASVLTHGYGVEALFRGTTLPKRTRTLWGVELHARLDPTLSADNLARRYYRRAYSLLDKYPRLFARELADGLEAAIEESARRVIADATPHCESIYDTLLWTDVFARSRYTGYLFLLTLRPYVAERSLLFNNRVIDLHLRMPISLRADNRVWLRAMAMLDHRVARTLNANTGCAANAHPWRIAGARVGKELWNSVPFLHAIRRANGKGSGVGEGLSPISWARFEWLIRNNPRLKAQLEETLWDPEALPSSVFDRAEVQRIFSEHVAGKGRHRDVLFALLTFGRWHLQHGRP